MMGLLARPAMETLTRRGDGAKASAAERSPAGGSSAPAAGLGAASLDTVPVIAAGVGETDEDGWVGRSRGLLRGFEFERRRSRV